MKRKTLVLFACSLFIAIVVVFMLASFVSKNKTVIINNGNAIVNKYNQVDIYVTTIKVENITATTADCIYNYQVRAKDKVKITFSGVRVLKYGSIGSKSFAGKLVGTDYKSKISGMTPGSIYTVQAYVTTATDTYNGKELNFETKPK